jgi:hypothetical protein
VEGSDGHSYEGGVSMSEKGTWRRALACEAGTCAEVRRIGDRIELRSSLAPERVIALTEDEWRIFLRGAAAGDFEPI